MRRLIPALIAFAVCATAEAQVLWISWEPMAIRADRTEPVRLELQLDTAGRLPGGNAQAARLDFAGGGSLTLTPLGGGRFTSMVAAAQLLFDYKADDVNRNFVGFVRLLDSNAAVVSTYNAFVNVVDANIPTTDITARGNNARQSRRIFNLHNTLVTPSDIRPAVQQFYSFFADDFDFVQVIFSAPSYQGNRIHGVVRNDVAGIGLAMFDNASQYGSAGHLLGTTIFPIDTFFDAAESTFSHETGHQWINYVQHPKLKPGPHWPPSTMAAGVMGINIPGGGVGGDFPMAIEPAGNGLYRVTNRPVTQEFSDFDLYLMGLLPASKVSPGVVLEGTTCTNCTMAGSAITVEEVIATHGPRLPDASATKKSFRVATIVVSRERLLNDDEMALLEYFAARGEARVSLPYSSGFAKGTTQPFYLATRGLASVDLTLIAAPKRRAVAH